MPRFSIIVPCFNAAETLPHTLASIAAQDFDSWELICVDDGSTDNTRFIIETFAKNEPRVKLCSNSGTGPSSARNHAALNIASGEIFAFCDADDLWHTTKLSVLNAAFQDISVGATYAQVVFFERDPSTFRTKSTVSECDLTVSRLLAENPVCTMSNLAVRRVEFEATGGFDTSMVHNEDLDWLIRLVGRGARVVGLKQVLVWYRASPSGLSSDLWAMKLGREKAIETAARFGVRPDRKSNAIHMRYLARRALRMGYGGFSSLQFVLCGLLYSPRGFFSPARRGVLTAVAALCALIMPRVLRRALFAN